MQNNRFKKFPTTHCRKLSCINLEKLFNYTEHSTMFEKVSTGPHINTHVSMAYIGIHTPKQFKSYHLLLILKDKNENQFLQLFKKTKE